MPRTAHVQDIQVMETPDGRFIVVTYDDGTVVRRKVEQDGKPRRKPRKPFARARAPVTKSTPDAG